MEKSPARWSTTLYYAQGLPFSIVRQMTVVFFKDRGASLSSLGFVSLFGIPWTFKFFWSPFIDAFLTKRKWVLIMEFLLTAAIACLAGSISLGASNQVLAGIFLIIAFISATHDIATDGFYLEVLDKNQQAAYSGWIVAAYRLAMVTGGGLLVSLSGQLNWVSAFGAAALIFLMLSLWHFFILPRPSPRPSTNASGPSPDFVKLADGFRTFLKLPGIGLAVAFIILFKLGDALLFGMSTPFLLDAGMSKTELGLYSGVFGIGAAIVASISGGWFISKFGLRRGLWVFGIFQNFAIPLYAFVAWVRADTWLLVVAIIVEQVAAGLGTAAYNNFLMRQVHPDFKATHYAIATGMMSLTTMLGGVLSGFGAKNFGYAMFFTLAFLASLPGLILVPLVARRPECQPRS